MLQEEISSVLDDMLPAWKEAQEQGNPAPDNGTYTFLLRRVGDPRSIPDRKGGEGATQPLISLVFQVLDEGHYLSYVFTHNILGRYPGSVTQMLRIATLVEGKPIQGPHEAYNILKAHEAKFAFKGGISRFVSGNNREIVEITPFERKEVSEVTKE